ncbi:hypothetical protein [Azotobacter armeniacus]
MKQIPGIRIKTGRAVATLLAFATTDAQPRTVKLPSNGADIQKTSVSGLSSGAFMTPQPYMVFSDIMVETGIVAGGPICARSPGRATPW